MWQVWVYEDADEASAPNLYVHHDIMLPAFPLSLAWMDCNLQDTSSVGNLAAVCTLVPWSFLAFSNLRHPACWRCGKAFITLSAVR